MSKNILEKIITISGKPGLYRILSQTRTGVIAESLLDKKRISTNMVQQINVLSEIQVYGLEEEVALIEIFEKINRYESGNKTRIKPKSANEELEAYFFEVFQDYDEDRVYPSDIKKIIQWYNLLLELGVLKFEVETPSSETSNEQE
tara:strand:- start:2832 stop:3269 length:438 start_codon:yes stop_codon:yes gene_type:complete